MVGRVVLFTDESWELEWMKESNIQSNIDGTAYWMNREIYCSDRENHRGMMVPVLGICKNEDLTYTVKSADNSVVLF